MKAAVYEGPRTVTVKDVPDARIEHPGDILVKITTTNMRAGSDELLPHHAARADMAGAAYGFEGRSHMNKHQLEEALGR